jgi:hypothetical protein
MYQNLFLNDPQDCQFDPATVQCAPGQDPTTSLSSAQVTAACKIRKALERNAPTLLARYFMRGHLQ